MVTHLVCNQKLRVRFSYGPPSFCPISIMVLHLFCNQVTAVRFCHGAPSLCRRFLTIEGSTLYLRGNRSVCSSFLGMVKWYHSWFGTMERRFDSFYRDQFLGCVQQILYIELLIQTVKKHPVVFFHC